MILLCPSSSNANYAVFYTNFDKIAGGMVFLAVFIAETNVLLSILLSKKFKKILMSNNLKKLLLLNTLILVFVAVIYEIIIIAVRMAI